ncbi:MAG: succinate--CoA ligase subunit alpha [Caldilineaceae bacterium SB0670_bin_27]|uniref:Succinate--CoA ligase [ADP-forming] subunit alpha n=1 Tax=Caldilineaceae bacterium SB0664_bin_27 TaxID=2605260 RepID=A0A6B0Z047_9CHLR|nr:succinate--CoA ligase subunit alpha [Caldilineaceae bacterium]MDE0337544.1 succinate--CoA ligase subunit alpha [Caldilineaceae bacterium]MXY95272.1 succinate--CoA ligase subunit alpha [Caldilineaceae bacterium SB0664_bin_27]MYJ79930.1 succinate--CoA ligase subunit alpha [Caldilineaceae bacterium SB0670_bin_27]
MSILVDNGTRLLVQGITGSQGAFHAEQMIQYGTNVVAGAVPGRGGQWAVGNTPVFDTVHEAVATTDANTSIIFVPAAFAVDALLEAADAGVALIVCITENIPALDMARARAYLDSTDSVLIGPNCPGLISPGTAKVGIMAGHIHTPGNVGIVSRSGTLTYEVIYALTARGIGQSTAVGIGGDPIKGLNFLDVLQMFEQDSATEQVVLIGEIGGTDEQVAADYIRTEMNKPVTAFIAGQTAPPGKRMGHAGAIISGGEGTAAEKIEALQDAGVAIARHPEEIAELAAHNI